MLTRAPRPSSVSCLCGHFSAVSAVSSAAPVGRVTQRRRLPGRAALLAWWQVVCCHHPICLGMTAHPRRKGGCSLLLVPVLVPVLYLVCLGGCPSTSSPFLVAVVAASPPRPLLVGGPVYTPSSSGPSASRVFLHRSARDTRAGPHCALWRTEWRGSRCCQRGCCRRRGLRVRSSLARALLARCVSLSDCLRVPCLQAQYW